MPVNTSGSSSTRTGEIYTLLRRVLLRGSPPAGTWLREEQLAERHGVSRTPIREALHRLEAEGLVRIYPRRGALVTDLPLEDLDEVYDIRIALEMLAATRAIGRITTDEIEAAQAALADARVAVEQADADALADANDRFHQIVYRASHSPRLWNLIAGLGDVIRRYRRASLSASGRGAAVVTEHARLLQAIQHGERALVEQLMTEHLDRARAAAIRTQIDRARSQRARATLQD